MLALRLHGVGEKLRAEEIPDPRAAAGQLALEVEACGVCRTDLHLVDGEVAISEWPRVLGHQIVARAEDGRRVGVPWLGWTCGECRYCRSGRENLCVRARFTGCDIDGGFAERTVADERFCFELPESLDATQAAPLLCAGLIGHRAHRMAGDPARLGIYGFGSAGHILCQVAAHEGRQVFAFTRPGDAMAQTLARQVGAAWAGDSDEEPPEQLDAAIIFAAVGPLVPVALRAVAPGGIVVCGGIHMSEIPSFAYSDLWEERELRSVANLTRRDAIEFLELAGKIQIRAHVTTYGLEHVNDALEDLRSGAFTGSAVVIRGDTL